MKKLLFALTILIMVTIPAALAATATVDAAEIKATASSIDTTASNAVIDLTNEVLDISKVVYTKDVEDLGFKNGAKFSIAAYSLNGGTKWTVGDLSEAKFKKALDKEMTLVITDSYDKKNKKVTGNSIKFPKINARPKANPDKAKPYYNDDGTWILAKKDSKVALTSYVYELAGSDKKNPAAEEPTWEVFSELAVEDPLDAEGAKVAKKVYLFRVPAVAGEKPAAGSKVWKVTPAQKGKATKFKVDYKKEELKGKIGAIVDDVEMKAKTLDYSEVIDAEPKEVVIYMKPTGKKPGTMEQKLKVEARAAAVTAGDGGLTATKLKVGGDTKKYQFSTDGKTWGKLPAITATKTFQVRLIATAKGKAGETDVFAAGVTSQVTFTVAKVDDVQEITGIVFAAKS